jgi:hypothetical protein
MEDFDLREAGILASVVFGCGRFLNLGMISSLEIWNSLSRRQVMKLRQLEIFTAGRPVSYKSMVWAMRNHK